MLRKCLILSIVAGSAAPLFAQTLTEGARDAGLLSPAGYHSRSNVPVYDNWTNAGSATYRAIYGVSRIADDFTVASASPIPFTSARIGFAIGQNTGCPAQAMRVKISFYPNFVSGAAAGTNVYQGTEVAEWYSDPFNIPANTSGGGLFYKVDTDFNGAFFGLNTDLSAIFSDPDRQYVVVQEFQDGNGTRFTEPLSGSAPQMVLANAVSPGTTNTSVYRDANHNGFIEGNEGQVITASPSPAGLLFKIERDVPPVAPATVENITLADGHTNRVRTANGVQWYKITLTNGAIDSALTFMDADSEGSVSDVDFAIYNSDGTLMIVDRDGGSGPNAQLSFGVGRRSPVGDGRDYDGRHYDRTTGGTLEGINAGDYYLAVAPAGAVFSNAFTATADSSSINYHLNFFTNVNGTPADPSVPPTAIDMGTVSSPVALPAIVLNSYEDGTGWWKFTTCKDAADDGTPDVSSYLDIDPLGSSVRTYEWFVFDSNGNFVTADNSSGPDGMPQLSFGDVDPARPALPGVNTFGLPFSGDNGNLPAGTYYMAVAYDGYSAVPDIINDGRWHLKNVNGSSGFSASGAITPSGLDCSTRCNLDLTQDGNVDADDVSCFISAVAGDPSCVQAAGYDLDVTQDGNVDADDVGQFIGWVAGEPCAP